MEALQDSISNHPYLYGASGSTLLVGTALYICYRRMTALFGSGKIRRDFPRDVVVLRQIPRGPFAPNLSPFPMKLETYLRMAKIPYVNEFGMAMSSKKKTPWMSYNDEDVSDTQFCVEYLNKKLDVDLNRHLTDSERAVARAFRIMTEDHLYWVFALFRWVHDGKDGTPFMKKYCLVPGWLMGFVSRSVKKMAHGQGIGRHTEEEIYHLGSEDIRAISIQIGDRPFLMGSEPCEEDAAVFGMLAQARWQMPSRYETLVIETYPNLAAYCDRMKDRFWPDWDDCITHGGTKTATK